MKPGDECRVYDRYNFAIPLRCVITRMSDSNDGVEVALLESNNVKYPVGVRHWVHARQLEMIMEVKGVVWEERPGQTPTPREAEFRSALESVINRFSMENGSNTPDFILAEYLAGCLIAYDKAVKNRATWYGRMDRP